MKCGRRSTGSSISDVYGSATQLNGRTRLTSLEEIAAGSDEAGEEIFLFHDVLSRDEEDPSTKAARSLDWAEFWSALSKRERVLIDFMIQGKTFKEVGQKCKISYSAIQDSKRDLAVKLLDFMGTDILVEVRRLPQWKQDLQAIREKMECREQRRHL
jgi:DNA-directed RNA polymerase specialized sigma subunit